MCYKVQASRITATTEYVDPARMRRWNSASQLAKSLDVARTWLSIRVDLVSGRGEYFWPRPGRVFAAAQSHWFSQLADAIDTAFARWDRSHLHKFELPDGRVIGQPEFDDFDLELLDGEATKLSTLSLGEPVCLRVRLRRQLDPPVRGGDRADRSRIGVGDRAAVPAPVLGLGFDTRPIRSPMERRRRRKYRAA